MYRVWKLIFFKENVTTINGPMYNLLFTVVLAIIYRSSIKDKLSRSDNPQIIEEKNDKIGFIYNP